MDEVKNFLKSWTKDEKINFPFENIIKDGRDYFLVNSNSKKLIKDIDLDLFSAGIFLGQKKKKFEPSMALISMLKDITDNKIIVNDKSAWLFACSRDIFEKNIVKKLGHTNKFVLVLNEREEVFGYAFKKREGQGFIYKNILDIGNYLRREMR